MSLHAEAISAQWGRPSAGGSNIAVINARMETASKKPTFRGASIHSRCIIVASGWYEWSAPKTQWHIQLCNDGLMAMSGFLLCIGG